MRRALLLTLLLFAVPATAQAQAPTAAEQATEALETAQDLAEGRGVRNGRELTPALQQLVTLRSRLSADDREQADELLARPTDQDDIGQPGGPYSLSATVEKDCSDAHFCVHWVETTGDAIDTTDASPANGRPDYVDDMIASLQTSFLVENGQLGWISPVSDGSLGGDGKTDAYIKDIGDDEIYGYASADPDQSGRSRHAFLVMDNDYDPSQFPGYTDPLEPMQVTAAHEYNHVLQYAYDTFQDRWMAESTATWSEEKVFGLVNDYVFYMGTWADQPSQPITADSGTKMYGSAIWNHWLADRYGSAVVRQAWAVSQSRSVSSRGFAPLAYDTVIKDSCGVSIQYELADFFSAVAEWASPESGIHEGASFPREVFRRGTLSPDGAASTGTVNHTAFALYTVPRTSAVIAAPTLSLNGGLPPGTAPGSIALVGHRSNGSMTKALGLLDADGLVSVSLDDPVQFDSITAVVSNTSTEIDGRVGNAWNWQADAQPFTLRATTTGPTEDPAEPLPTFTPCTPPDPDPDPDPSPSPSPTATPTPTPTVTPTPTPRTTVGLTRSSTKLATITRKGVLSFFARTNKDGRLTAKATVDRATSVRLKVGRRTTSAGTARRTFRSPARLKINVKLTRKVRAALKRHRGKAVTVRVAVSFTPNDGTGTVRRTFTLRLRR